MPRDYSVAMTDGVDAVLRTHLIRQDRQEDLSFALWSPSGGTSRMTALVHTVVLPEAGDRQIHGNVSFAQQYVERVCRFALAEGVGIAFLHSHPFPGWQHMSEDDVVAEQRLAGPALSLTGLPLVGLTVGSDGTWSARAWEHARGREYARRWAESVRVVGAQLKTSYAKDLLPRPVFREMFKRTVSVWGSEAHSDLARLRVGIVGLGSVGALVAESLARMGLTRFVLIDFDRVEPHNLDRLVTATESDIGRLKVDVAEDRIRAIATAEHVDLRAVPFSVVEEAGYRAALDCDVIFCCVDRPRARHIVNHIAYAHLIPIIDGGIGVRFKNRRFSGVDWQVQTVGPGRPCLECLGSYDSGDVATETAGMLDDPTYLGGLADDHRFKRNENVFPFSANLASLKVLQLIALTTGAGGVTDFGVQRYRYWPGIVEQLPVSSCRPECERHALVAQGDKHFSLLGRDVAAERSRMDPSTRGIYVKAVPTQR
jgi:molybdopterin/thiamine biosynthesis adenylyltransferase